MLQTQTTVTPAAATLAGYIMTMQRRAAQAGRQLQPTGHLGLWASLSGILHEPELLEAVATEVQLRYGCQVTRLTVLGGTDHGIAVAFDAQTLERHCDPVDVLTPFRGELTLPLQPLRQAVREMLALNPILHERGRDVIAHLRDYAASLDSYGWPDGATRLLVERAIAGNMTLILRLFDARPARL